MLTTRELMLAWYGVDVRTRRVSTAVVVGTALTKLCSANAQRVRIRIANPSLARVDIQHSLNLNAELPVPVPPQSTYLEDWDQDDDQVETEFWGISTGIDPFGNVVVVTVNVIELLLI